MAIWRSTEDIRTTVCKREDRGSGDTSYNSAGPAYRERGGQALPSDVADCAKQHFLDSLIVMLSGATLRPGLLAVSYAQSRGGVGESYVAGGPRTNAELAAFATREYYIAALHPALLRENVGHRPNRISEPRR